MFEKKGHIWFAYPLNTTIERYVHPDSCFSAAHLSLCVSEFNKNIYSSIVDCKQFCNDAMNVKACWTFWNVWNGQKFISIRKKKTVANEFKSGIYGWDRRVEHRTLGDFCGPNYGAKCGSVMGLWCFSFHQNTTLNFSRIIFQIIQIRR